MRATKGYVAGVGTTSALVGAIGCAFAVLSAIVAVQGWPLKLNAPGASTVEGRDVEGASSLSSQGLFPALMAADAAARAGAGRSDRGGAQTVAAPVASAFGPVGPAADVRTPGTRGSADGPAPAAGAAGPITGASAGPDPAPGAGSDGGQTAPPPSDGDGGSAPTLGGTVAEVTSGAGTAVSQTGQQLGSAVQGATGQLGGTVGQVSPAAGQLVTQSGQTAGGVVSGATGAVSQVVAGTGAAAGSLLGGLGGGR
jgi:hypothetical protein